MLMDGLDHPKTLDLAARLDASIPQVIGHLELLWAFVAQKTPTGNIGKWPDGTIARAAQWTEDPSTFVTALDNAGFLDQSYTHRYVVHDWPDHCPRWVHAKLKKTGQEFAIPDYRDDYRNDKNDCRADCRTDCSSDSMPSHAMPSHAKPTNGTSGDDTESDPAHEDGKGKKGKKQRYEYPDDFETAWAEYPRRDGQNNKRSAYKAFKARQREGVSTDELLDGVKRYTAYLQAKGQIGTKFVKQASSFFGPDAHYADDYQTETSEITIDEYLADCKENGVDPVPSDDAVFDYAEEVGIPNEHLKLCWVEFVQRNRERGKRYSDWKSAFRNCVRERWYSLWYFTPENEPRLTANGQQAMNKYKNSEVKSHAA